MSEDVIEVKVIGRDDDWRIVTTARIAGRRHEIDGFTSRDEAIRAAKDLEAMLVAAGGVVLGPTQ